MNRRALILVDIQNDFCPGGALAVPEGDQVIPVANRIQRDFSLVIATQDWHPPDHLSFAANHPGGRVGEVIQLDGLEQVLWPVHCVQDTPGAELAPELSQTSIERVFRKGVDREIDSYSGFFDNGRRRSTGLDKFLSRLRISQVFIVGLATDYCVKYTALDAVDLGYETHVLPDACRAVNLQPEDGQEALREMAEAGVRLLTSDEM